MKRRFVAGKSQTCRASEWQSHCSERGLKSARAEPSMLSPEFNFGRRQLTQFRRSNQLPRLTKVRFELFVADPIDFDSNPTPHAYVRRPIELLRRFLNQHLLNADRRRHRDRDVAIAVMIVREHGENFFSDKPRRLAMRNLFPSAGKRKANAPHALDLGLAVSEWHGF